MFSLENQRYFRILIYSLALVITAGSLWYTNGLVKKLGYEEEKKVQLYADAMEFVGTSEEDCEVNFVFNNITKENHFIPTILVDEAGKVISAENLGIKSGLSEADSLAKIESYLMKLKDRGEDSRIDIEFYGNINSVYYDESIILKQLRIFPYLQLLIIAIFISIVFAGFSVANKNEQNKVWVGLAKETAHQLGTPVSSLMAWVELLKLKLAEKEGNEEIIEDFQKDVIRLETITERFSKIGSKPELNDVSILEVLTQSGEYIRKRMSKNVSLEIVSELKKDRLVPINPPLFEWVIENLLKNALDAIQNETGQLKILITESSKEFYIDVSDTGKGIPKHLFKQIFSPGFTTKKRGWGLGLSLTKRIVENYHNGKIFVKSSEIGNGTTFRIILKKKA